MHLAWPRMGTMGIRSYDGTPRQPIFDRWVAARTLPLTP
jgi:hypothetical protein